MSPFVGREEAGAVHRLLADEHRRQHRHVPLRDDAVERPAVERELEQRHVADPVDEARARHLRAALDVDPAVRGRELEMVARLEVERRRLADLADLDGVLLVVAVGRVLRRRVRDAVEQPLRRRSAARRARPRAAAARALTAVQLLELLGRRLALQLRLRAQLLDLRLELAPALVGREQLVERRSAAPLRASAAR